MRFRSRTFGEDSPAAAGRSASTHPRVDYLQLVSLLLLLAAGLVFIFSTGVQVGTPAARSFFGKQLLWIAAGSVLYCAAALTDYRRVWFRALMIVFYFGTVGLLILVLGCGVTVYGATRWLELGAFRLQPSEFAKLAVTGLLAVMFASPLFNVNRWYCLLLSLAAVGVPLLLIAREPDLGSAAILLPVYAAAVFCAGLKKRYVAVTLAAVALAAGGMVLHETLSSRPFLRDYQRDRIRIFLNPESDRSGRGHNAYQARLAVGSGGMFGKGIGEGTQNTLGFLPQTVSNNDFIFSVIAEETGFCGCLLLLSVYLALFYSVFRTAYLACDPMGRALAVGVGAFLFAHVFINVGMSVGVTPITGLSLPFVSYGGSFVVMGMLALGVLQSVYRNCDREE